MHIKDNQFICNNCKKDFEVLKNLQIRFRSKHHFCSKKCFYEGRDQGKSCRVYATFNSHHLWTSGRHKEKNGYVRVSVPLSYPGAKKSGINKTSGRIFEHRFVIQNILGRILLKSETVHHKNGKRDDNRIENLELRSGNHGVGATVYTEDLNRLIEEMSKIKNRFASEFEYLPNTSDC